MSEELTLKEVQKEWHGSYRSYFIGFISSLLLTLFAFTLAAINWLSREVVVPLLATLAIVQAAIQLRYFLHLGEEAKPRWETVVFFSMLGTLLVIAIGTLWIMYDLNIRVMPHMAMDGNNG